MTQVLKVADFEKLANEFGLIPMKFLKATITEYEGDIRGAEPATALRWYNEGLAEPVNGTPTPSKAAPAPAAASTESTTYATDVEIPDNWADEHGLRRVAIARELLGDPKAKIKSAEADTIIAEALAQRAGTATDGEPDEDEPGEEGVTGDVGPNAVTSRSLVGE